MSARVLVVDDEPQIRRALGAGLRSQGMTVELAPTGEAALDAVALGPPDVVVLDLGLPDCDGVEVVRQLREWSVVPIIVLSVRERERDKVAALEAGADDYVTKPFGMAELVARVRVALRHARSTAPAEPVLTFGELRIDLPRRLVSVAGRAVHLTPNEYDLLVELAGNAGKVMTHQMLLSRVWGPASADATHYLRVYINQLRRKLEQDPSRPRYILTEPGVGYRFRDQPAEAPASSS